MQPNAIIRDITEAPFRDMADQVIKPGMVLMLHHPEDKAFNMLYGFAQVKIGEEGLTLHGQAIEDVMDEMEVFSLGYAH